MGVCNCSRFCCTLLPFWFCNYLDGEEGAGCFAWFVLLLSCYCCVALPRGAMGLSAVCDCGISLLSSLTIFATNDISIF